jgi:hypothetical protein
LEVSYNSRRKGPAVVPTIDEGTSAVAARHGGHVTARQLRALGLSDRQIDYRVAIGRLIPVHKGVYAVGHLPTHPHDTAKGALLACARGAALYGWSAAFFYEATPRWGGPIEIVTGVDRRPRGLKIHTCRALLPRDIRARYGVRVVSPALMVLQIAPTLKPRGLKRTIEDLRLARHLRTPQLADVLARFPRHAGARYLRAVEHHLTDEPTRSAWEDEWIPFGVAYDLPPYTMNHFVHGHRVDVYFERQGVIVELDGWSTHHTRDAFEHDRDVPFEILAATGIITVRITYEQFHAAPATQATRLRKVLNDRRDWSPSARSPN